MIPSLGRTDPILSGIAPDARGDPPTPAMCFHDRLPTQPRKDPHGTVWPEMRRLGREMRDSANKNARGDMVNA